MVEGIDRDVDETSHNIGLHVISGEPEKGGGGGRGGVEAESEGQTHEEKDNKSMLVGDS